MKKILTILIIGFILMACSNDKDCCVNIDTAISIKYVNVIGKNLLELDSGFGESDITVYHRFNNEWVKYFEGNLDYPKGIRTVEGEDGKYLVVISSTTLVENNYSETKIEFSGTDSDTIKTEFDKSNSNEIVTKVWYNGELKWEGSQGERSFEVIK